MLRGAVPGAKMLALRGTEEPARLAQLLVDGEITADQYRAGVAHAEHVDEQIAEAEPALSDYQSRRPAHELRQVAEALAEADDALERHEERRRVWYAEMFDKAERILAPHRADAEGHPGEPGVGTEGTLTSLTPGVANHGPRLDRSSMTLGLLERQLLLNPSARGCRSAARSSSAWRASPSVGLPCSTS